MDGSNVTELASLTSKELIRVMGFFCWNDTEDLWWRLTDSHYGKKEPGLLQVFIQCSDVFFWGSADVEEITSENFAQVERAYKEYKALETEGNMLGAYICAKIRGERPQGAISKYMKSDEEKELFKACGPEKKIEFGNPKEFV